MKNRWKRLAAVLGAATLVVCQNGVIQVRAEEAPAMEESALNQETGDKEEVSQKTEDGEEKAVTGEKEDSVDEETEDSEDKTPEKENDTKETKEDDEEEVSQKVEDGDVLKDDGAGEEKPEVKDGAEIEEPETEKAESEEGEDISLVNLEKEPEEAEETADVRAEEIQAVTNLRWKGKEAVFYNPNTSKVRFEVHIFKDGDYPGGQTTTNTGGEMGIVAEGPGDVTVNLSYCFDRYGEGDYTFIVVTFADGVEPDHQLGGAGIPSEESGVYSGQDNSGEDARKLLAPTELRWNERGQAE